LKLFFQVDVSYKKTNERILLYYYETSGWLVFVHFLKEIEDTKKTFRNYLTYRKGKKCAYFIMLQIKALIKKMSLIPYLKILFTLKRMLTSQSEFKKNIFWLYNIENFIWFYAEVMYKSFSLKKESFSDLLLKYRLLFLRPIAQFFYPNLHELFCHVISWTNWVNSGKFMDNCWISCQFMADMKKVYDNLIIINLYRREWVELWPKSHQQKRGGETASAKNKVTFFTFFFFFC
jgi:hypothetical protein